MFAKSRKTGLRRPERFYGVNKDSPQFQDLVYWYPLYGRDTGNYVDIVNDMVVSEQSGSGLSSANSEFGRSLLLDGTGFLRGNSPSKITGMPLTICGWARPDTSSDFAIGSLCASGGGAHHYEIETVGGNVLATIEDASFAFSTLAGVVQGSWQHVGGTFTSTTKRQSILNGVLGAAETTSISPASIDRVSVGVLDFLSGPSDLGPGALADVRFYKRALNPDEVWRLYDPQTRWDLYWIPSNKTYFYKPASVIVNTWPGYQSPYGYY